MNLESITLQFMGIMLLYSLLGLCILAAGGGPFLALLGERLAISRRRVFLDKMGGQLAAMAGIFALCTIPFSLGVWVMSWAGGWITMYLQQPDMPLPEFSLEMAGPATLLTGGLYALALVLVVVYWLTWKPMRKSKPKHSFLGGLTVLVSLLALAMVLGVKRTAVSYPEVFMADQTLRSLFTYLGSIPLTSPFWAMLAESLAMCAAAGAGMGMLYLVIRRKKDDFGRDYYTFALKKLASWALVGGALCLFTGGWLAVTLLPELPSLQQPEALLELRREPRLMFVLAGLFCLLLSCVSWGAVERSQTPLRHKPSVVLAACFLWLSITFQGIGLYIAALS